MSAGGNFTMLMSYFYLAIGFAVLILSGNWLVTGSVQLARYFKISTLIVGLTIVAWGTSAPEMFISIGAALENAHDIALGNIIGSNIANIGFILALVALIHPIPIMNRAIGFDLIIMFLVIILLFFFGLNGIIGRFEGLSLVFILIVYSVWSILKSRKDLASEKIEPVTIKPLFAIGLIIIAIIGLYLSSGWFVRGAREIALHWGVSERVIAVSIVAVGTSMPELIATVIAAFRKEVELSIGNIIGSNLFNIAGVLGVTTVISPIHINDQSMFLYDMIWVFGISVALLLTMIPLSKGKITRREGGVLLLMFTIYIFILFR